MADIPNKKNAPSGLATPPCSADCRAAFEAWITAPPFEREVSRWPDDPSKYGWPGNYRDYEVELAWTAWQDSRYFWQNTEENNPSKTL